jgi:hypothetical protein
MKNIGTQVAKAVMAAALGAAFVGTALAASPIDGVGVPGGNDPSGAASSPEAPKLPDTSQVLDNPVTKLQAPKINGIAYVVPSDNGSLHCYLFDGETSLPGRHGKFQHPTQCKHNSVAHGKAEIAGHSL